MKVLLLIALALIVIYAYGAMSLRMAYRRLL
jgi:hypothetical protein